MIWLIPYTIIGLVLWRRWAGYMAVTETGWNWSFGAFFGGIGALFWPVILSMMLIDKIGTPIVTAFTGSTHWLWSTRAERETRKKLKAKALKEAEKEVGLSLEEPSSEDEQLDPRIESWLTGLSSSTASSPNGWMVTLPLYNLLPLLARISLTHDVHLKMDGSSLRYKHGEPYYYPPGEPYPPPWQKQQQEPW